MGSTSIRVESPLSSRASRRFCIDKVELRLTLWTMIPAPTIRVKMGGAARGGWVLAQTWRRRRVSQSSSSQMAPYSHTLVTAGQVMLVPFVKLTSMSASQHLATMEELATTWWADSLAPVQKVSLGWLVRGTSTSAFRTPARMGHYARITPGALTACANLDLQVQSVTYLLDTSNANTDFRQGIHAACTQVCYRF